MGKLEKEKILEAAYNLGKEYGLKHKSCAQCALGAEVRKRKF